MTLNFDQVIDRHQTNCIKWDRLPDVFGLDVPQDTLALWIADMDFPVAPPIVEAMRHRLDHPVFGYTFPGPEFFQTCVDYIGRHYHWQVQSDWLTFCPGIVPALNMAVMAFTKPGDKVISLTPVYGPFKAAAESHGRAFISCDLDLDDQLHASIDFDKLESLIDDSCKLLMLCSPHNPLGRVWTRDELSRLGQIALKHNLFIISDEIHADFVYPGQQHTPLASLSPDLAARSITCYAPSKTFNIAGLAASVLVIPNPQVKKTFDDFKSKMHYSGNLFAYTAMQAAWSSCDDWLAQLITYLEGNRDFLYQEIKDRLPQVQTTKPEGTYLLWMDFKEFARTRGLDSDQALCDYLLQKAGLALNQGSSYGLSGQGFMRLNFACPRSQLAEAVDRLAKL